LCRRAKNHTVPRPILIRFHRINGQPTTPFFMVRVAFNAVRATAIILLLVVGSGCRLIPRSGPVPQEVADARRLCNEGLSAADRNDLMRAEGLLEQAVKNCPTDVDARRHYADVLWHRGERMAAVTQIAEALRLSPGDTSLCIDGGRMYMELGLLDDADRLAREAVRSAPRSDKPWHLHGQVALARGRPEEALADFHRAMAIAPDDRELILETAEIYRRLGRPKRALATLAILGESYPPNQTPPHVLALEGMAQEALDRPEDAIESYRQAVARGLQSPDVSTRLVELERATTDGQPTPVIAKAPAEVSRQ
jgi:tetratricopeptide (TPR) repeat protein